jgi:hypothetical protein
MFSGISEKMITTLLVGPKHIFFGYYSVDVREPSQRYHLAFETDSDDHHPESEDGLRII